MYYNRRTIVKAQNNKATQSPFNESGKLKKGYRYSGNGEIKDSNGNTFLISDYK